MTRSSTIPIVVPDEKIPYSTLGFLYSVKENVDYLFGRVKLAEDFATLTPCPAAQLRTISATGAQVRVPSGPYVADAGDYATLVTEVKALANDVAAMRRTIDSIVDALRAQNNA